MNRRKIFVFLTAMVFLLAMEWLPVGMDRNWSAAELKLLDSLSLGSLDTLPAGRGNAVADDPRAAVLGERIFFDSAFSANGRVSCSTCHQADRWFTDGLATSVGVAPTQRNAMSLIGAAYSPWYFWDGRKDSLWSQALAPLESSAEHGSNRMAIAHRISTDLLYREAYEALFGILPEFSDDSRFPENAAPGADDQIVDAWEAMSYEDQNAVNRVFANVGKSLEAYQRFLLPQPTRFDRYVESLLRGDTSDSLLSQSEIGGLRIFIGRGQCVNCHNGPLLTNNSFHNTGGLPNPGQLPSKGRSEAVDLVLADPFNCQGEYSDRMGGDCAELLFMSTGDELMGAHRTPSLRNVTNTAPYLHAGQLKTLISVLEHYSLAPAALVGHNEAKPLRLSATEIRDLEAFLGTLQ